MLDETWESFLGRFERCELQRPEWTHAAHLTVATIYVSQQAPAEALERTRAGIVKLNAHFGVPQTPTGGYHETITVFFVRVIAAFLAEPGTPAAIAERIPHVVARFADKRVVLEWYSRELIESWEARTSWREPDLRALTPMTGEKWAQITE